jgi:hypothetical protein
MTQNPYQSPSTFEEVRRRKPRRSTMMVQGDSLVVASGEVLPPVCVKTGQPVDEADFKTKTFYWCSPFVLLVALLGGLLLIVVYFVLRKKCVLTYAVHPTVRRQYRNRILLAVLLVFAFIGSIAVAGLGIQWSDWFLLAPAVAFVLMLWGCTRCSPLSVSGYYDGMFTFKGCSREFLNIADQPGQGYYAVPTAGNDSRPLTSPFMDR